jgi:hypothetical protein
MVSKHVLLDRFQEGEEDPTRPIVWVLLFSSSHKHDENPPRQAGFLFEAQYERVQKHEHFPTV